MTSGSVCGLLVPLRPRRRAREAFSGLVDTPKSCAFRLAVYSAGRRAPYSRLAAWPDRRRWSPSAVVVSVAAYFLFFVSRRHCATPTAGKAAYEDRDNTAVSKVGFTSKHYRDAGKTFFHSQYASSFIETWPCEKMVVRRERECKGKRRVAAFLGVSLEFRCNKTV